MISIEEAEKIHTILIEQFGGGSGIRDKGALLSALSRPFQTFGEEALYPSISQKAAALIESILINHPFVDGNKRTGYVLMRLLLLSNDCDINASEDDKYNFVIEIAAGQMKFERITAWLEAHIITKNK